MRKYMQIIESLACILKIFDIILLFLTTLLFFSKCVEHQNYKSMSHCYHFTTFTTVTTDQNFFLWILVSASEVAAVNLYGVNTLLANAMRTFFINGNSTFSSGPRSLSKKCPDCIMLDAWVLINFISLEELFAKTLRRFTISLLVNTRLRKKLF